MPEGLDENLGDADIASVIVVLRDRAAAGVDSSAHGLADYFVSADPSRSAALGGGRSNQRGDSHATPPRYRHFPNLGVAFGTVDPPGLAALRKDSRVESIVGAPAMSLIRPERGSTARLSRNVTWGIERLGIEQLWAAGLSGEGVLVTHLDTGVDPRHPALRGAVAHFAEFDWFGQAVEPAPDAYDSDTHGTHTAGIIAGRPVGDKHIGVAPKAKLASSIVIEGGQTVARVLGGMDWAIGLGSRVLNLSLGLPGASTAFVPIMRRLRERNVLPVIAIGNEGQGTSRAPGNHEDALSVGAIDEAGNVAEFSSSQRFRLRRRADTPALVAPGCGIISAWGRDGYHALDGTSMAAPHVSGLAALLLEAKPDATNDELERALLSSCGREPSMRKDRAGNGVPDGGRALAALLDEYR